MVMAHSRAVRTPESVYERRGLLVLGEKPSSGAALLDEEEDETVAED